MKYLSTKLSVFSTKIYFQATILMNIEIKYLALVSTIQKNYKDENINLVEANHRKIISRLDPLSRSEFHLIYLDLV